MVMIKTSRDRSLLIKEVRKTYTEGMVFLFSSETKDSYTKGMWSSSGTTQRFPCLLVVVCVFEKIILQYFNYIKGD